VYGVQGASALALNIKDATPKEALLKPLLSPMDLAYLGISPSMFSFFLYRIGLSFMRVSLLPLMLLCKTRETDVDGVGLSQPFTSTSTNLLK
jgi:hypothetical protein